MMKGIVAALTLAFAATSPSGSSDLTVRTRARVGEHGPVEFITLQISGARRRLVRQTEMPGGTIAFSSTDIVQCDAGRALLLNSGAKLYAVRPIVPPLTREALAVQRPTVDTRPVAETWTIDAVETGERRTIGPLTARHVVTTITAQREGTTPEVTRVRDGWYADLAWRGCGGDDARYTTALFGSIRGGRVDVKWRGTARTGYPLIERDRTITAAHTIERTTELIAVTQAPIPSTAFEVPDGYRRALALPGGGVDLSQPDTIPNRLAVYWRYAAAWVSSFWR